MFCDVWSLDSLVRFDFFYVMILLFPESMTNWYLNTTLRFLCSSVKSSLMLCCLILAFFIHKKNNYKDALIMRVEWWIHWDYWKAVGIFCKQGPGCLALVVA